MTDHILTNTAHGVLHIRINRPEKKNALSVAMYAAMADALGRAESDDAIRVVTITGTGDSFTSGNDILDFLQNPPQDSDSPVSRFLKAISTAGKPLVAAVNGVAVGVGVTMLLHCDLVYAAEDARFQLPFVNLGLVPEAGSSLLLPRLVGHRRAAELFMFGEPFDAVTARQLGLVNAVYAPAKLAAAVEERALVLAKKPPTAIRIIKSLMKGDAVDAVTTRMQEEGEHFRRQLQSAEAREAMQAFMQRRKSA